MQRGWKTTLFFSLSLSFLFTSILFAQGRQQPAPRWEYKTVYNVSETDLDKLGDEGWELVASAYNPNSGSLYYTLKRPKPANAPRYVDPNSRPLPTTNAPTCNLPMAQAPAIRGIRLGMTVDELLQLFPGADPNTIKAEIEKAKSEPSFGVASIYFNSSQHRDREQGLGFQLVIFDGRVVSINSGYHINNHTTYGTVFSLEQFIDKIAAAYQLPGKESWTRSESKPTNQAVLRCKEVEFQVFSSNLNFSIIDPSYLEKQQQRKTEALAKKRAEFKP